jgi:hypothetical protein
VKVAALTTVLMDVPLKPAQEAEGIRGITPSRRPVTEGRQALEAGVLVQAHGNRREARVTPELVPVSSPLYGIEGTTSIVEFETDVLQLSLIETDPGPHTTAYVCWRIFLMPCSPPRSLQRKDRSLKVRGCRAKRWITTGKAKDGQKHVARGNASRVRGII